MQLSSAQDHSKENAGDDPGCLKLCLFLGDEVVVGTSMCFPIACLAFTEKNPCCIVFAIAGDIAI